MRELALVASLIAGAVMISIGLYGVWHPLPWLWLGFCVLFVGWRLVRTR